MSAAKLNKLHWHLADDQAFPLVLPSLPNLSKLGAFSPAERYSPWEVAAFIEFAASRGVEVIPEVVRAPSLSSYRPLKRLTRRRVPLQDIPGHSSSWCAAEPSICPSACPTPLSPASPRTITVLASVVADLLAMFGGTLHFGGDEVWTECWESSPEVVRYLQVRANPTHRLPAAAAVALHSRLGRCFINLK